MRVLNSTWWDAHNSSWCRILSVSSDLKNKCPKRTSGWVAGTKSSNTFWDNSQITTHIAASLLHQHSAFLITKPTSLASGQVLMLRIPSMVIHIFTKQCCSVWLWTIRSFKKTPRENEHFWCLLHRKQKHGYHGMLVMLIRFMWLPLLSLPSNAWPKSHSKILHHRAPRSAKSPPQQGCHNFQDYNNWTTFAIEQKKINSKKHQEGGRSCLHLEINSINFKTFKTLDNSFFPKTSYNIL